MALSRVIRLLCMRHTRHFSGRNSSFIPFFFQDISENGVVVWNIVLPFIFITQLVERLVIAVDRTSGRRPVTWDGKRLHDCDVIENGRFLAHNYLNNENACLIISPGQSRTFEQPVEWLLIDNQETGAVIEGHTLWATQTFSTETSTCPCRGVMVQVAGQHCDVHFVNPSRSIKRVETETSTVNNFYPWLVTCSR